MRNNQEYIICKQIAIYLRLQYPNILYHFDYAGLNHSKAQAGMMKAIQGDRGFPDLIIIAIRNNYSGMAMEIKKEGTKLNKKNGDWINEHIKQQADILNKLRSNLFYTCFGIGFDDCKKQIDDYLK